MKLRHLVIALSALFVFSFSVIPAFAGDTYVNGYTRKDGTYVQPHYRSSPNNTVTDNYSYTGNTNPHTGSVGTNNYEHDTTSPYFNGTPYGDGHYGHENTNNSYGYGNSVFDPDQ